jgi:hypothetical protein
MSFVATSDILCGDSRSDAIEIYGSLGRHDPAAFVGLQSRGIGYTVEKGTGLTVATEDELFSAARVESGLQSGRTCWLLSALIPREAPKAAVPRDALSRIAWTSAVYAANRARADFVSEVRPYFQACVEQTGAEFTVRLESKGDVATCKGSAYVVSCEISGTRSLPSDGGRGKRRKLK